MCSAIAVAEELANGYQLGSLCSCLICCIIWAPFILVQDETWQSNGRIEVCPPIGFNIVFNTVQ